MIPGAPELRTRSPSLFTPRTIVAMCLWGLLLMGPVVFSFLAVSVMHLGVVTFALPLATIAVATFFLPFGFGNTYLGRRFRSARPSSAKPEDVFLVQLTRTPRHRSGLLALLEDADDIGFLSFTDSVLLFEGDSIQLSVPYDQIRDLALQNSGWRALFAYGPRTEFAIAGLAEAGRFSFAERSSWHLPGSRRNARLIYSRLSQRVPGSASVMSRK